jgi:Protein of unknown function (DUF2855)
LISDDKDDLSEYVHPVVWGIAQVTKSKVEGVPVGTKYLAMLPMGENVSFSTAHLDPKDTSKVMIHRPETVEAYNTFIKIDADDPLASPQDGGLALACFPGIITGFGLYFRMVHTNCYGAERIVITSASSKVALAMALFVKNDKERFGDRKIIGYTSESTKKFCESTGLYDEVLGYDEPLGCKDQEDGPPKKFVMIEISGRGDVYELNEKKNKSKAKIVKLLAIGNSANVENQQSTFAYFSTYATIKLMLTFMGAPAWVRSWMNPTQELYLITDDKDELTKKWGADKFRETQKEYARLFCDSVKDWIRIRECDTEQAIGKAFTDMLEGSIPPTETIVLDAAKALKYRRE